MLKSLPLLPRRRSVQFNYSNNIISPYLFLRPGRESFKLLKVFKSKKTLSEIYFFDAPVVSFSNLRTIGSLCPNVIKSPNVLSSKTVGDRQLSDKNKSVQIFYNITKNFPKRCGWRL